MVALLSIDYFIKNYKDSQTSDDLFSELPLSSRTGPDADTTGAVYGQLAGAYYGETGIPEPWRSKITFHDLIVSYAERLSGISKGVD
jgi:ADP-ribosyl-[dinitrogen reductase] hydrolase